MDPEDRALVEACLRGEAEAWERLLAVHGPGMRRAALHRLRAVFPGASGAEADDVLQRQMAKLHRDGARALASFDGRARLGTWLVVLALREATDFARAERRSRPAAPSDAEPEVPSALSGLVRKEEAERLHRVLGLLPARDALLLKLVYWDGAPYAEVARVLGVAGGSVSPLLGRARDALRRKWEESRTDRGDPAVP